MEAPQAHCNFCGKHLVMGEILYTPDARVACVDCNRKVEVFAADVGVGHNIRNASIFSLCSAGLAFFVMWFPSLPFLLFALLLTVASIWAAIHSLRAVNQKGDERFTQHIQKDKGIIYACSIIALVIDAFILISILIALVALFTARPAVDRYEYRGY